MLNKDYYKKIYDFIDYGIIIFDRKTKAVEYVNDKMLFQLSLERKFVDYDLCERLKDTCLRKSEIVLANQEKIGFTVQNDNIYEKLLKKGPMVIFTWKNEENWPTSYVSKNIENVLGYSVEDFTKGHIFYSDIIYTDDLERVSLEVENAVENDKEYFYHEPYRLICKSGKLIWVSDFTILVKNNDDNIIGFHGYINNINELMKVRSALTQQEERRKEIINAADLGTWEWHYETGEIIHNEKWFEMFGYKPEDFQGKNIDEIVSHPEDLEEAKKELQRHIDGKKKYYEIERRIKQKDNGYTWILDKGRIIESSKEGVPIKIFGVHVDISQQKTIEERFKLFMNSAEEIFIILNNKLEIEEINNAAIVLIPKSMPKREIIGQTIDKILPFLFNDICNYSSSIDKSHQKIKIERKIQNDISEYYEVSLFKINNDIGLIGRNITTSVLHQKSIEQMNENFNKILSALAFGVVLVSMDKHIKWANDKALQLFGINNLSEIEGKYCKDFICIDNKNRQCLLNGSSDVESFECKIRNKNNKLIEVMKKVKMIEYENEKVILESFVDISERKKVERKLENETERLKNIYRVANIGVFDFDFIENKFYMNKNQYRIFEIPRETSKNDLVEVIKSRISYEDLKEVQEIPKTGDFSFELELDTPSKKKNIRVYGNIKSRLKERFHRIIGACIDITELKDAENKAIEANHSKSVFLANMSHEIRTPLNGILGFTEALLETEISPKQVDYLNTIKSSGISLTEIIEDILNLAKIEAGKMELIEEFIDIRRIVSEAIDIVKLDSYKKGVRLLYNIELDEESQFKLDSVRIKQVLINLLGNAIKFTDNGYVRLSIYPNENEKSIHFVIVDTGIGISKENQIRIMESFYQGEPQITRKYGGSGLGLTISNRILKLMDSKLEVTSKLGEGSSFSFDLELETKIVDSNLSKRFDTSILVIDSNSIALESLVKKIKGIGYITYSANNISEASYIISEHLDVNKIFVSSEFDSKSIRKYFDYLEVNNRSVYLYIYSFKLYDSHFIKNEYQNVKYEYISRPLSRRKIRDMINGNGEMRVEKNKEFIITNSKVKILIAEDNLINTKLLKTFIKIFLSNVQIFEVVNGLEVLSTLEVQKIDLVFMDIQMPIMDGIETTKKVREINKEVPIIGLSALTEEADEISSRAVGMNDFIRKPISRAKVFDTIKKWIT